LWGNIDEKEKQRIPANLFAFDEDWTNWLGSYRDLSDDKPISLFEIHSWFQETLLTLGGCVTGDPEATTA
jgi:hypothetical protein